LRVARFFSIIKHAGRGIAPWAFDSRFGCAERRGNSNLELHAGTRMGTKTKEQISYNMQRVRNKDSQIELLLRKELWRRGHRYRKNVNGIEGKPDIVFLGKKVAVFCDSEFWHGYNWEERKDDFKSNRDFWIPKIERNMMRDVTVNAVLEYDGWTVLRFWGRDIKKDVRACADAVEAALRAAGTKAR
jgi:DNA mismatch endonuclease (patch repair protein)